MDRSGSSRVPSERRQETNLRRVEAKLAQLLALDPHPLAVARPFEQRLLGNCRDFSLLLCAMLRHHHIPARVRSGFATFFDPVWRSDHWVCEYWSPDQARWIKLDLWMYQVDQEQSRLPPSLREGLASLGYTPLDVQPEHFWMGGQAWQRVRSDQDDASQYGYGEMWGLWFIRDNMLRDLLGLNKVEVLPWDCWRPMSGQQRNLTPCRIGSS